MSALRSHRHRGIIYIDDSLWMANSAQTVEETGSSVVNIFQQADFQTNEKKSSTYSINHVLGLRDRYSTDDSFFTTRESLSNFQRNSKYTSSTTQTSFCYTCHTCRSCCICCLPVSFVWKETKRSLATISNILRENDNIFRTNYGIKMVDSKYTISNQKPVQFQDPVMIITTYA